MSLASFLTKELKYAEADIVELAATSVQNNQTTLTALVGSEAPEGVAAFVALVRKADAGLGPAAAALINGTLSAYEPEIEAELTSLVAAGGAYLPSLSAALEAVAAKLQAEAAAG